MAQSYGLVTLLIVAFLQRARVHNPELIFFIRFHDASFSRAIIVGIDFFKTN